MRKRFFDRNALFLNLRYNTRRRIQTRTIASPVPFSMITVYRSWPSSCAVQESLCSPTWTPESRTKGKRWREFCWRLWLPLGPRCTKWVWRGGGRTNPFHRGVTYLRTNVFDTRDGAVNANRKIKFRVK